MASFCRSQHQGTGSGLDLIVLIPCIIYLVYYRERGNGNAAQNEH